MSGMKIVRQAYEALLSQAVSELPNESCGYLLGNGDTIIEHYPMTNTDHSPEHFAFDPREQFAALRYARSKGLTIIANWHSHPASPSRPSQEDIRLAADPTIAYAILSLAAPEPVFNAFRIKSGQVEKVQLTII